MSTTKNILVIRGDTLHYTITKTGYKTINKTKVILNDDTITETMELDQNTFTINPTPNDATVVLTAAGYTQVGNSITVPSGTSVAWEVSKEGYITQSGTEVITENYTKNVELAGQGQPIDVTGYNYTNIDQNLVLTKYVGTGGAIIIPNLGE